MAKLYFRYGAMNSGKSSMLMQVAHNYNENNKKVVIIKSSIDTKGNDYLESRIGLKRKVDILLDKDKSLKEYFNLWIRDNISCILVDEAQFLSTLQVDDLWYVTKFLDISVICYGIRTNFKSELFEGSKRLMEVSDELEELVTICKCGKKAKFNARFINGKFDYNGNEIMIDGQNNNVKYIPMCGKCYMQKRNEVDN